MSAKVRLFHVFPTADPFEVLGVVLLKLDDGLAIDIRVFEKSKGGLNTTPRGMTFPAAGARDLAEMLLRAVEAADMWAFLAEEDDEKPKAEKPRSGAKAGKKTMNDVVVQFPKGNAKDHHPEA